MNCDICKEHSGHLCGGVCDNCYYLVGPRISEIEFNNRKHKCMEENNPGGIGQLTEKDSVAGKDVRYDIDLQGRYATFDVDCNEALGLISYCPMCGDKL